MVGAVQEKYGVTVPVFAPEDIPVQAIHPATPAVVETGVYPPAHVYPD